MTGPRIGSLCSGYGGLDMGVQSVLGGTVAWHVEYDRDPSRILDHHWPDVPNHGDVKLTDWSAVETVDILTAGYPCQPFSHAGKRKGADDPRHLWPDVERCIGVLRPGLVVLENVRGHVSLGLADVLGDLSALGYDATWGVVRAADAGAPHSRARIFIVAADTRGGQLARPAIVDDGLLVAAERGGFTAADADRDGHGPRQDSRRLGRLDRPHEGGARQRERARQIARDRGAEAAADADGDGRARLSRLPSGRDAVHDDSGSDSHGRIASVEWGAYRPAVERWARILGRPAPAPTEPGRSGHRLSPVFVEWLMGLPDGHVTDPAMGLSRNAQLKALGNGVVPQQAALALRTLLPIATEEAA